MGPYEKWMYHAGAAERDLVDRFDAHMYKSVIETLLSKDEEYREGFLLWVMHQRHAHYDAFSDHFKMRLQRDQLREAIGVCVPSALRCFIDLSKRDGNTIDVEITEKVLARVEKAMKECEYLVISRSLKYHPVRPAEYREQLRKLNVPAPQLAYVLSKTVAWVKEQLREEDTPQRLMYNEQQWTDGIRRCVAMNPDFTIEELAELLDEPAERLRKYRGS